MTAPTLGAHGADPRGSFATFRGRPLRVLHGVYEIAGQATMLARALRLWGCEARSFSYGTAWDRRASDIVVDLDRVSGNAAKGAVMLATLARRALAYDVFHLHFGTSFLPRMLDVPLLARLGKKVVFHVHGCDVRNRAHMLSTHRASTCTDCDPFCRPRRQRRILELAARHADAILFSTLDLDESVPGGRHFPLATDAERFEAASRAHPLPDFDRRDGVRGPVVVGHAPTDRLIKGTRHVVAAVERLRAEFPRLELRMLERRPWDELPQFLAGCDILVDQLMMGWYGLLAIEGMAAGRPVALHIREDLRGAMPDLPIAEADPVTLASALRALIRDPARRAELGERGRAFVRARHDLRVVGKTLLGAYLELLGAGDRARALAVAE